MDCIDWNAIKTEYITTNASYRELCKKYNINPTTLYNRGKREEWVKLREQHKSKIVAKATEKAAKDAVNYKSVLYELAYKMALQLKDMTEENSLQDLTAMGIKPRDITGAIKDLEDALHVKSEADLKEQEARIAKLRKDAEKEDTVNEININIGGWNPQWQE